MISLSEEVTAGREWSGGGCIPGKKYSLCDDSFMKKGS
jgi:hypothetical protein